jgi:hypothetical protein
MMRRPRDLPARPAAAAALALVLTALTVGTAGCIASVEDVPWVDTQRYPKPMNPRADLPPGSAELYAPGPEVVLVVRTADPVQVRRAGEVQGHPLHFYDKRERVQAGSFVHTGSGGRAELAWANGTTVKLSGDCTAVIGSTSRGDPTLYLLDVAVAVIVPRVAERFELAGGAELEVDAGPVVLERVAPDVLRVRNSSRETLAVAFRDARMVIDPGELVDLPILAAGARPTESEPESRLLGSGFSVATWGDVRLAREGDAIAADAGGPGEVEGLGVRVRVAAGDRVWLSGAAGTDAPPAPKAPRSAIGPASAPVMPPREPAPDAAPEPTPDAAPEPTPDATPEPTPDESPDESPEPAPAEPDAEDGR